ncbi:hypothetical protein GUJ93_ZPchr0008g13887 [Zizania palustris]|uniref:Uncharacterized protein n=1 Tax=Zizania palustris TaxID=103762 RepID=A0A8J5RL92_ZIZPA|nr:hypothetical protein GUJ93_ZPchr0008g13887 [Zizania palustris]
MMPTQRYILTWMTIDYERECGRRLVRRCLLLSGDPNLHHHSTRSSSRLELSPPLLPEEREPCVAGGRVSVRFGIFEVSVTWVLLLDAEDFGLASSMGVIW